MNNHRRALLILALALLVAASIAMLALLGAVLMLGGTLTATFLALSDARPDLSTMAAVGARPRTRRRVAAGYALIVGGVGALLGALGSTMSLPTRVMAVVVLAVAVIGNEASAHKTRGGAVSSACKPSSRRAQRSASPDSTAWRRPSTS